MRLFVNRNSVTKLEEDNMSSYNATTDYLKSYGINNPKAIFSSLILQRSAAYMAHSEFSATCKYGWLSLNSLLVRLVLKVIYSP